MKSTSGRIALIDPSTQSITCDFHNQADGEGSNVVFDDDGKHVVDASWEGAQYVRTLDGKTTFREVFNGDMVTEVLRHPDGRYWFRHKRPNERLIGRRWPFKADEYEKVIVPFDRYNHAAFSPDGLSLAVTTGLKPRVVTVFSFPEMEPLRSVPLPSLGTGHGVLCFSPCGKILAISGDSPVILNSTTLVVIDEIPMEYAFGVAFSPTEPLLAVGSSTAGEVFATTRYLDVAGC